jgi:hypothetical protein
MEGPFIFIATNRLKPGKLGTERQRVPGLVDFIEANEPRLIAFNEYVNDEGTEVGVVQVHPDTASFELHMTVVRDRAARAYEETLDATTGIQVFGKPDRPRNVDAGSRRRSSVHREATSPGRLHAINLEEPDLLKRVDQGRKKRNVVTTIAYEQTLAGKPGNAATLVRPFPCSYR